MPLILTAGFSYALNASQSRGERATKSLFWGYPSRMKVTSTRYSSILLPFTLAF